MPVLRREDPANRFPDLVVFREEHVALTKKRLTITRQMPPPLLIAEVVSPGKENRERDYEHKRVQYAQLGVLEYWLIDPETEMVTILALEKGEYQMVLSWEK